VIFNIVFLYGFESDSGVDLRVIFVKVCEGLEIKFNR